MNNKKMSILALSSIAVILGACATKPDPVADMPEPAAVQRSQAKLPAPVPVPAPESYSGIEDVTISGTTTIDGPIPGSVEDFSVNVGDRVFFGYNEDTLSPKAVTVLRSQAQWLEFYPSTIVVIGGHADERGTREYNLALGARRAEAVKDFLVSQGIDPNRVTTVSYGKERPIDGRSTEEAHALNRNGHTAIISGTNS